MAIQEKFPNIRPSLNLDFANTKTLDPRIAFSRASTATYYDGKTVAKAEENLLRYSQEFDNDYWVKTNVTVTANTQVAPDGTTTADLIVENTATGSHSVVHASYSSSEILTYSFYAKAGTRSWVWAYFNGYSGGSAWFDVGNGVIGAVESGVSATITSVGNGWYRCTLTKRNATFANSVVTAIATGSGSTNYTGDGTSGIYIWGAQLEQRPSVTAYSPTTNQPITNYIPVLRTAAANVARFDHNPVTGESLGLLIEEQRTNLLVRSQEFISPWVIQGATVVNNAAVALDGSQTAALLVANLGYAYNDNNARVLSQFITLTGGTTYTWSIYAKAAGVGSLAIRNNWTGGITIYNLTDELTTANKQFIGNGWYRCFVTYTPSSTSTNGFSWRPFVSGGTADGTSGIYIWGAQLEAGATASSYIPTAASQVTRSADTCPMTGTNFSSWFSQAEGTLYAEINPRALAASSGVVLNDNTTSNRIRMATTSVSDQGTVTVSGSAQATLDGGTPAANTSMKLAMAYKANDFALSLNGGAVATDTVGTVPVVTQMQIGAETTAAGNLHVKKVAFYPKRLTNTQLQALTS